MTSYSRWNLTLLFLNIFLILNFLIVTFTLSVGSDRLDHLLFFSLSRLRRVWGICRSVQLGCSSLGLAISCGSAIPVSVWQRFAAARPLRSRIGLRLWLGHVDLGSDCLCRLSDSNLDLPSFPCWSAKFTFLRLKLYLRRWRACTIFNRWRTFSRISSMRDTKSCVLDMSRKSVRSLVWFPSATSIGYCASRPYKT